MLEPDILIGSDRCQSQDNSAGDGGRHHFGRAQDGGRLAFVSPVFHEAVTPPNGDARPTVLQTDGGCDDSVTLAPSFIVYGCCATCGMMHAFYVTLLMMAAIRSSGATPGDSRSLVS